MDIDVSTKDGCALIKVNGELDRDTLTTDLWKMLTPDASKKIEASDDVELDLSSVGRVDTAGLAWLLNAIKDFRQHSQKIEISHIPQKLLQLAKLSNADTLITQKREEA